MKNMYCSKQGYMSRTQVGVEFILYNIIFAITF